MIVETTPQQMLDASDRFNKVLDTVSDICDLSSPGLSNNTSSNAPGLGC